MKKSRLLGAVCATIFSLISISSHAALISVLGGQAYYDDQLDITWAQDANINGLMDWNTANAWAAGLTIAGVGGWRLPSMDVNGDDVIVTCTSDQEACKDNEYGHLYKYGAGTVFGSGITSGSPGPFSNVQSDWYWSSTEYAPFPAGAWDFSFNDGSQLNDLKDFISLDGWAVQSGNVGAVPVPGAMWLFGSGLVGLIGVARRKKAA